MSKWLIAEEDPRGRTWEVTCDGRSKDSGIYTLEAAEKYVAKRWMPGDKVVVEDIEGVRTTITTRISRMRH